MTTHCTSAMVASNDTARVGRVTFAMLVPREGSSIASDNAASRGQYRSVFANAFSDIIAPAPQEP